MHDARFITIGQISHNVDHIELVIWDHDKEQAEVLPSGWTHSGADYRQLRDAILGKPIPKTCGNCNLFANGCTTRPLDWAALVAGDVIEAKKLEACENWEADR